MTDPMELLERLEGATEGCTVTWCNTCGRTAVSGPGIIGRTEIWEIGNDIDCAGSMVVGTLKEAIVALKARMEMEKT